MKSVSYTHLKDDGHAVVYKPNALCWFTGQNGKYRPVMLKAIDSGHVDDILLIDANRILWLAFLISVPFEIPTGRDDATSVKHTVHEGRFLSSCFAPGIDQSVSIGCAVSPFHCKRHDLLRLAGGDHRHRFAWKDLAGRFDGTIAVILAID